jgi:hypothetical protein
MATGIIMHIAWTLWHASESSTGLLSCAAIAASSYKGNAMADKLTASGCLRDRAHIRLPKTWIKAVVDVKDCEGCCGGGAAAAAAAAAAFGSCEGRRRFWKQTWCDVLPAQAKIWHGHRCVLWCMLQCSPLRVTAAARGSRQQQPVCACMISMGSQNLQSSCDIALVGEH